MRTAGAVRPGQAHHQAGKTDHSPRELRIIMCSA